MEGLRPPGCMWILAQCKAVTVLFFVSACSAVWPAMGAPGPSSFEGWGSWPASKIANLLRKYLFHVEFAWEEGRAPCLWCCKVFCWQRTPRMFRLSLLAPLVTRLWIKKSCVLRENQTSFWNTLLNPSPKNEEYAVFMFAGFTCEMMRSVCK